MIRSINGKTPKIHETAYVAESAQVIGDVTLGKNSSIWDNAVVRGDLSSIYIGENTSVQDVCSIHNTKGIPVTIGNNVSIGHGAILHSCSVGNNTIIGMGSVVLDNAVIGENCIISAGAVVTPNTRIPDGSLVMGVPGRVVKPLTPDQIEGNLENARDYVKLSAVYKAEKGGQKVTR
jgi:carbonic anhydrase/acetyltransferase-like protein (isoleucine patch superfamily)